MLGRVHYVPILKWKQAEWLALSDLDPQIKDMITPLIEIQKLPTNQETEEPTLPLHRFVERQVRAITEKWGSQNQLYVDTSALNEENDDEGVSGQELVYRLAADADLPLIPVIELSASRDEVAIAASASQQAFCLRIKREDLEGEDLDDDIDSQLYRANVESFLSENNLDPEHGDIIFDAKEIDRRSARHIFNLYVRFLRETPYINQWRNVIVTSCAFPDSLSGIPLRSVGTIERTDWLVWNALHRQRERIPRVPTFSDYGIQHPIIYDDLNWGMIPTYPSVRYTDDDRWIVFRGESSRDVDARTQYPRLASQLMESEVFRGPCHCEGCRTIEACARRMESAASPQKWRRISTCHHITLVCEQLNQLSLASDTGGQLA